jgi:hypothetical protein
MSVIPAKAGTQRIQLVPDRCFRIRNGGVDALGDHEAWGKWISRLISICTIIPFTHSVIAFHEKLANKNKQLRNYTLLSRNWHPI